MPDTEIPAVNSFCISAYSKRTGRVAMTAPAILRARSPNEMLNIASIGVGGRGWSDVNGATQGQNLVAFCDVVIMPSAFASTQSAMLAATDPISVVALFKEFTVSKRLGIIIEGESLINDGIAVVIFAVVVKITSAQLGLTLPHLDTAESLQAMTVVLDFLREVLLGTAIGLGIGLGISYLTSKFDDQHIEVALTVIAAYGANVVAMELHASGVIAVVVCGMMIGNVGVKHGMSPTTREEVVSFWEFAAFLANSFVFILIGLEIKLAGLWDQVVPIVLFFVIMILVRAVTVFGVHGLVRRTDLRLKQEWLPVITWAGVRGSLSMVLAMMLIVSAKGEAGTAAEANRLVLLNIVYGVVLMSILLMEQFLIVF